MTSRFRIEKLTGEQVEVIRAAHGNRRGVHDVARELGCSPRTVAKYYQRFGRGENPGPKPRAEKRPRAEPSPHQTPRQDRFYHSNFEPS